MKWYFASWFSLTVSKSTLVKFKFKVTGEPFPFWIKKNEKLKIGKTAHCKWGRKTFVSKLHRQAFSVFVEFFLCSKMVSVTSLEDFFLYSCYLYEGFHNCMHFSCPCCCNPPDFNVSELFATKLHYLILQLFCCFVSATTRCSCYLGLYPTGIAL